MKKAAFVIILASSALMASAQTGNWYVGGLVGYGSETDKTPSGFKTTTSSWAFAPEVGTFLKDDIQLGVYLGLSGASQKDDNGDNYGSSFFSPTLYGRKFWKVTDDFSLFAGLYLNFISGTITNYPGGGGSNEFKQSGFGFRLGVGIAYALSPRFTAVGQYGLMGYQDLSNKQNGNDTGSTSSFDFGVNTIGSSSFVQGNGSGSVFNIGLYYTLKKIN